MWYGGGCDLTPFYVQEQDYAEFHAFWKGLCDRHDAQVKGRRSARAARASAALMCPCTACLLGEGLVPLTACRPSCPCCPDAAVPGVQGLVRPVLPHPLPQGAPAATG